MKSEVRVIRSSVLCVCFVDRCLSFCTFFVWPLCFLSFFDLRNLITSSVSSNSSYRKIVKIEATSIPPADIYMTADFCGLVQALK
jgi:hypothetical protein